MPRWTVLSSSPQICCWSLTLCFWIYHRISQLVPGRMWRVQSSRVHPSCSPEPEYHQSTCLQTDNLSSQPLIQSVSWSQPQDCHWCWRYLRDHPQRNFSCASARRELCSEVFSRFLSPDSCLRCQEIQWTSSRKFFAIQLRHRLMILLFDVLSWPVQMLTEHECGSESLK